MNVKVGLQVAGMALIAGIFVFQAYGMLTSPEKTTD